MNATVLPILVEAALRSLAAAAVVWAVLRLLRVHNVPAQKTAWSLVLAAALAMPFAVRWLPAAGAIQLPRIVLPSLTSTHAAALNSSPSAARFASRAAQTAAPAEAAALNAAALALARSTEAPIAEPGSESTDPANALPNNVDFAGRPTAAAPLSDEPAANHSWPIQPLTLAGLLYIAVAAVLLLRLLTGLAAAFRLWFTAQPVSAADCAEIAPGASVRCSSRVSSPANIASGIVLPVDCRAWEPEKLRIVLAHEHSHIRQGDFYLQLLAGLYTALFWFSPLGWWLKRKLSELGEAMGDRAALQEAASRSSYARLLLEFAAHPRPTLTGVAMARTGNLTPRIERLLNETNFSQAFAAGRRRAALVVLLVPAVLFVSAAQVRVQAAGQDAPQVVTPQLTSQAQSQSSQPSTGVSQPTDEPITTDQTPTPTPAPASASAPFVPAPPQTVVVPPIPPVHVEVPAIPPVHVQVPPMPDLRAAIDAALKAEGEALRQSRNFGGYSCFDSKDGDAWALVQGSGQPQMHIPCSRQSLSYGEASQEIAKARKMAHGPFLWFEHGGKSYIVEDPSIVAQIEAMQKPIENLRSQMREVGGQMRALGQQMREQGRQQRQAEIPKPDLSKEMADLNAAVASLKNSQGNMITQQQLMQLQRRIAEIQRRLSQAESGLYAQYDQWGKVMGEFGAQEGKLGAEQGRLGAQMAHLAARNQAQIRALIAQTLRDGKARPVR